MILNELQAFVTMLLLCNFSESKMAAATILDFGIFSTFDLHDLGCHVIHLFMGFQGWGNHIWNNNFDRR